MKTRLLFWKFFASSTVVLALCMPAEARRLKEGDLFPSPTLQSISKVPYDKKEHKNRVVVYDLGASWTEDAAKAMSYFQQLQAKYQARGLKIVIINLDESKEKALEYTRLINKDLVVLYDEGQKFARSIKPKGFPMAYIVDRKGVVRAMVKDYCEHEFEYLEQKISAVLDAP